MTEKGPKTSIESCAFSAPYTEQLGMGVLPPLKTYTTYIIEQILKIFSPMVINVHWIPHTHEQSHFFIDLCDESIMIWSMFEAIFLSFCNHEIFVKLNLPIFLKFLRQREKSQKYFDLLAFNWNLNHSNP